MFYDAINERYVSQVVYYDYDDVRQNSTEYYFYKLVSDVPPDTVTCAPLIQ